jgi:glycerophosphoryl diester phosphodiesterase
MHFRLKHFTVNRFFLFCVSILFVASCKRTIQRDTLTSTYNTPKSKLLETFGYSHNLKPLISVHRGGKGIAGYPENCLETIKYINDSIHAIFEIDVAQTRDSILVLMHDNSIDRTTTGSGKIKNKLFSQLEVYNLIDDFGLVTPYKIPRLDSVLRWAKEKGVILTLDVKNSTNYISVVKAIRKESAQDIAIIITYDLEQSLQVYNLAPELMQSVSARNHMEFDNLLDSDIPKKNMIAFTGTRLSDETLYKSIHSEGIRTILGTLGNLDSQAASKGDFLYEIWIQKGIDIIATDRPFQVAERIKAYK